VKRAVDMGKIDPAEGESLIKVGRFCESVLLSSQYCKTPTFDKMKSWSGIVDKIE
jgi:hypothetical protein